MYIFAEPVTEEQAAEIQTNNNAKIEEFERDVLGRGISLEKEDEGPKWADIQANVEEAMNKDEMSLDEPAEPEEGGDTIDSQEIVDRGPLYANEGQVEGDDNASGASAEDGEDVEEDAEQDEEVDDDEKKDEEVEDGDEEMVEEDEEDNVVEEEAEDVEEEEDANIRVEDDPRNQEIASAEAETELTEQDPSSTLEEGLSDPVMADIANTPATEDITASASADEDHSTYGDEDSETSTSTEVSATTFPNEAISEFFSDDTAKFPTKADRPFLDDLSTEHPSDEGPATEILAMTLTLRNKVNGAYVHRPENMTAKDTWDVEYSLVEVPSNVRARALYEACQMRRQKKLDQATTGKEGVEETLTGYVKRLREMSSKARVWREALDKNEEGDAKKVLGREPEEEVKTGDEGGA